MPLDCYMFLIFFPIFSFLHSSFSPSKEKEPADVRQEKLDLRLRYGVHHQRHAHRSQSDAAERHGVTTGTVSTGVRGDRTAMTSPFLLFAAKAGPTTDPRHFWKQSTEFVSLDHLLIHVCFFLFICISSDILFDIVSKNLVDGDGLPGKRRNVFVSNWKRIICCKWRGKE